MKTYDLYHEDNHNNELYANVSYESDTGDWVPAEVAQRLYDVVQGCKAMGMLTVGYDSGCDHRRLCADAESALALADGDNT